MSKKNSRDNKIKRRKARLARRGSSSNGHSHQTPGVVAARMDLSLENAQGIPAYVLSLDSLLRLDKAGLRIRFCDAVKDADFAALQEMADLLGIAIRSEIPEYPSIQGKGSVPYLGNSEVETILGEALQTSDIEALDFLIETQGLRIEFPGQEPIMTDLCREAENALAKSKAEGPATGSQS